MSGFTYITPEQAAEIDADNGRHTAEEWRLLATRGGTCCVCDSPVWVWGDCDMCFSCTTGESDPSEDYEVHA